MAGIQDRDEARGREAESPGEIPSTGWKEILLRVKSELTRDHVSVVAAGVAFFGLLALFPAIAALISLAALVMEPSAVEGQLEQMASFLPSGAAEILQEQGRKVASGAGAGIGFAALGGLLLSLYSAAKGMKALIEGMNIAYDEEESRSFVHLNLLALALTSLLILGVLIAAVFVIVVPAVLGSLGLGNIGEGLITYGRWLLLGLLTIIGLATLYHYGPSRDKPKWKWVSYGSVVGMILWILGSIAFSLYVRNFGSYNETYGALGGVIILFTWLWLSAYIVLLGAELNSEIEHQTARDTTKGSPQPMGQRNATKADTLPNTP